MSKAQKSRFEKAVADRVADLRRQRGLSQDAIATMLEVTRGFIGQVESPNSPSSYSLDHLNRLAFELNCSLHDLLPKHAIAEPNWDK
jgi:transcriptional regulator with XRE-family HTH domain